MTVFDLVHLDRSVKVDGSKHNGTGSGTLYVQKLFSADAVVGIVLVVASQAPSTTDTFAIGSLWIYITGLGTTSTDAKLYIKTAATTWTVVGAQS